MIGKTLAGYEVTAKLGAGGMGEVYRAHDPKLGRDVALKILPEGFAANEERLSRFDREARLLASLNHANIASIYGLENDNGRQFLVLELVEGEDLSERLVKGSVGVEEAIEIARQVALGLEAAHEQGVVHRDLKPANIKITPTGTVKVLDFGLAKALDTDLSASNLSNSPTVMASSPTVAGVILGTAAYMSPEQAKGKPVDRRADIWAFGVVLYEMLIGKQLFAGETISDTLAAVIRADIDLEALPKSVPPAIVKLLRRCLDRDPTTRLRDIGEARIAIERVQRGEVDEAALATEAVTKPRRRVPALLPWAVSAIAVIAALVFFNESRKPEEPVIRAMIPPPVGTTYQLRVSHPGPVAISPDGTRLAFTALRGAASMLFVRDISALDARELPGTEEPGYPFWSPDGRHIGYFAAGKLRRIGVDGEPPLVVTDASDGKGGSWNEDGTIIFAPVATSGIHKVRATGGESTQITQVSRERAENSNRFPQFLPDGEHFLYFARGGGRSTIRVGSLDGETDIEVIPAGAQGWYADGYLLFPRDKTLMAQPFDVDALALTGEAFPVVTDLNVISGIPRAVFSVAPGGRLVYMPGTTEEGGVLRWIDREGKTISTIGDPQAYGDFQISPDNKRVCTEIIESDLSTSDLWIIDLETGIRTRFTFDPGDEWDPVWSPDGSEIIFCANPDGQYDLYRKKVEGAEGEQLIYKSNVEKHAYSWSPDGNYVLFQERDSTAVAAWALDLRSGEAFRLTEPGIEVRRPYFSPDGRWFMAGGTESGRTFIFVQSFPKPGRRWQVSTGEGVEGRWGASGKIYYQTPGGTLMEVDLTLGQSSIQLQGERTLFETRAGSQIYPSNDGQLFIDTYFESAGIATPMILVSDWKRGALGRR